MKGKETGRDGDVLHADWVRAHVVAGRHGRVVKTFIVEREGKGGSLVPLESRLARL